MNSILNKKVDHRYNRSCPKFLEQYMMPSGVCDSILKNFNDNSNKHQPGRLWNKELNDTEVTEYKKSTDLVIIPNDDTLTEKQKQEDLFLIVSECHWKYLKHIENMVEHYSKLYEYFSYLQPFDCLESMNIQWYKPNEGYNILHFERDNSSLVTTSRVLVFMTYLNDVIDGGGTEFYYQDYSTDARKGRTIIWPAEWMFTHRGIISPTENKYIITGWIHSPVPLPMNPIHTNERKTQPRLNLPNYHQQ